MSSGVLLAFCALLMASQRLSAQAAASVVGTIRDSTGATVPGARVTITSVQTALSASSTTGADGIYSLLLLPVGEYKFQVEAAGFQGYLRSGITLAVNDKPTIDVILQVGNIADSVTVTGSAPLIEAQTGTLRGLVDQQRIVDLPLNGRDMRQLLTIQAGVLKTSDSSSTGEGIAYAVNGSRGNGVSYLLDGGYNTSTYRNWAGTYPNPDAVQEFSFQRNSFSAEYGSAFGGVVSVVTKSGTNEFHGSAFEFVRNYLLNARNFFATQRDSLKRNQFGGTFGGPIIKDKLFFFAAFQQTDLRSNAALTVQLLPTAAQRAGNFSSVTRAITDPLSGQAFPGNQIPVSRISPVTQAFLKYLPDPGTLTGQRLTGAPSVINSNEFTGRVDLNLSKHRLSGKFFGNWQTSPFNADPNDIAYPLTRNDNQPYRQISFSDFYTISPTMINSATFAYRYRERNDTWGSFDYPISYTTAGIQNVALPKPHGLYISVSSYFAATPSWPYDIKDADWSWSDSFTYTRGRHELKFGGEFLHSSNQILNTYRQFGFYTFSGAITTNALADFMLGNVYQFWQGGGEYKDLTGNRYGLFALDNMRVSPNLTLNLGVRWDPTVPYTDSLGRVQCFVPGQKSTRFVNAPVGYLSAGDSTCPGGGFQSDFREFSPRLGFAWRPGGGRSVVRGGFGLFWDPLFTVAYNTFVDSAPFSPQETLYGVSFDNPYKGVSNPFPAQFAPFKPASDVAFFTPLGQFGVFVPNFKPSYMEGYNLTLEREVARNLVARLSYVGNLGRHLSYSLDDNYARYIGDIDGGQHPAAASVPGFRLHPEQLRERYVQLSGPADRGRAARGGESLLRGQLQLLEID
jgi:outer membrane receptor protein involved in Fe transport